jgi:uncharacterized protein
MKTPCSLFLLLALGLPGSLTRAADYPYQPVPFTAVRLMGGFWAEKQAVNRTVTVPFALQQCEASGRLRNFDLAAETMRRRAAGEGSFQNTPPTEFPFDDSDVYKAIEGAAYVLHLQPDAALDRQLDGWIARIASAQEPDGYLYSWRTMHPDAPAHRMIGAQRWERDPAGSHELYNVGHLYEAGVAHFQATGKRTLLDICLKNADLVARDFGDGTRRIAPGHEVIEMGLVKLYRVTGERRYLDLARVFLEARGPGGPVYNQLHLRVVDQDQAVGHAVRANYLYAGMADVAALTGDDGYVRAIRKISDNVLTRKLYLTGGVGALAKGEAYGADYELPADGYNETCAAIALMMWQHRMFLLTGEAAHMDVFERTAFNGFLSGVSATGDRFFYPNPLVYDGAARNNHKYAGRAPWFGCACCPPNLVRTIAALSGYFYAVRDAVLYVNCYAQSTGEMRVGGATVRVEQTTDYPWSGAVKLVVSPDKPARFTVRVRIPGWAQARPVPSDLYSYAAAAAPAWQVRVGGVRLNAQPEKGYVAITREWRSGDTVALDFPLPVQVVRGHEAIAATRGQVAFERGPVVYCFEQVDQPIPAAMSAAASRVVESAGDGPSRIDYLRIGGARAVPYYAWNNRGLAPMAVWLPREDKMK